MSTPLRQKMIEDMQLHGFAARTQEAYLLAVSQLARYYRKSPDLIDEEELRRYFLYLINEKHAARNTCTIALCSIKFFFENTLGKEWKTFELVRPPREKKLPVVLSVDEVRRILECVRTPRYRVCLTIIYACGLRLLEGVRLQVKDIDGERGLVHIRHGKGSKDRCVPLPSLTIIWRLLKSISLMRKFKHSAMRNPLPYRIFVISCGTPLIFPITAIAS